MADQQESLPPGFKTWPPANPQAFLTEIDEAWKQHGGKGKHWLVQGFGTNPLSGYSVVIKPTD